LRLRQLADGKYDQVCLRPFLLVARAERLDQHLGECDGLIADPGVELVRARGTPAPAVIWLHRRESFGLFALLDVGMRAEAAGKLLELTAVVVVFCLSHDASP